MPTTTDLLRGDTATVCTLRWTASVAAAGHTLPYKADTTG